MRALLSALLVTSLMASVSLAGTQGDAAPLAPGKPAGTLPAQSFSLGTTAYVVLGAGAVLGALLALQSHGAAKITTGTPNVTPYNQAVVEGAALNTNP